MEQPLGLNGPGLVSIFCPIDLTKLNGLSLKAIAVGMWGERSGWRPVTCQGVNQSGQYRPQKTLPSHSQSAGRGILLVLLPEMDCAS